MISTFLMVSTSSITMHAKLGEDRTTRAGWKYENVVFVCFFLSVLRYGPPARCSFEWTYFEQLFCRRLLVDFDSVFIVFRQ